MPDANLYLMSELAPVIAARLPQLGRYGDAQSKYAYVNLVLRELALLGRFNRAGKTYTDSMTLPQLAD